jgi:hypothetical protein
MTHPYSEFEDSVEWIALRRGIEALEQNGDITLTTAPTHVIGYLCKMLHEQSTSERPLQERG